MGVPYNEENKFVHVTIVVPDGRLVAHRTIFYAGATEWHLTVCRRIFNDAKKTVSTILWTKFELDTPTVRYGLKHLSTRYVVAVDRLFEIYRLDLESGIPMIYSKNTEVKLFTLEEAMKEAECDKYIFARESKCVMAILKDTNKLERARWI